MRRQRDQYRPSDTTIIVEFLDNDIFIACWKFLGGRRKVYFADFLKWVKKTYVP